MPLTLPPRTARWLLFASLALNLIVIGSVFGARLAPPERRPPPVALAGTGSFTRAFTPEQRHAFGEELRHSGRVPAPDRARLQLQAQEIGALLAQEPFDSQALEAVLAQQRATSARTQEQVDGALIDYLTTLSAQERAALARAFLDAPHPRGRKGQD